MATSWLLHQVENIKKDIVYHDEVDNWFLMPSCVPVISIVVVYLLAVNILGPKLMQNRKPFNITNIILVYNLVQTVYNAWIVSYLFIPGVIPYLVKHSCTPQPREENLLWPRFTEASYLYYISKIIDCFDTIFFVLRKKQSQITFLHVYHHAMMVMTSWGFLRYFKGEQVVFIGLLNSLVHVVMYSYYFLAALGPRVQRYLWWKKYLTKFQLLQFALFCTHQLSLIILGCDMPVALTYYIFFQAATMCVLFGNFYYQTYVKVRPKKQD